MAEETSVKVVASHETGLVGMFFDAPSKWYAVEPDEMIALAEELICAAREVKAGPANDTHTNTAEREALKKALTASEEALEDYLNDVYETLKREEEEAHGGD